MTDLKTINTAINAIYKVIKAHYPLDGSENHWSIFFDAAEDIIHQFPDDIRPLMVDWLLSYSKFIDIQLRHADPDSHDPLPPYLMLGAERFISYN